MRLTKLKSNAGFTIVELMIALSVLSVILVTTTIILIQIGALYSKGVNQADLQNANRTVVADISGQLQFSGKVPNYCQLNAAVAAPTVANTTCYANTHDYANAADGTTETVYSYCISNVRYSYTLNRELGTDSTRSPKQITPHVLWRDTLTTNASTCPTMDITQTDPGTAGAKCYDASGNTACLDNAGSGYEMLGDHMRLTRYLIQQTTASSGIYSVDAWMAFGDSDLVLPDPAGPPGHSVCNGGKGTQFCAVSSITTQLTGRIY